MLNGLGNGAHSHISVHSTRPGNEKSEKGMNKLESTFLAGVMTHLPSLPAFTLPTPASYKRGWATVSGLVEHTSAGAQRTESAPFGSPTSRRRPAGDSRCASSMELQIRTSRLLVSSPLPLWRILASATLAFRSGYNLTLSDCSGTKTAAQMTEAERLQLESTSGCRSPGRRGAPTSRQIKR